MVSADKIRVRNLLIAVLLIAQAALAWFVVSHVWQKKGPVEKKAAVVAVSPKSDDKTGLRAVYKKMLLNDTRIDASDWDVEPEFFHYLRARENKNVRDLILGHSASDLTISYLTGLAIRHLGILDARVTARGFKEIGSLEQLDWLELYKYKLTPDDISVIVELPHLTSLRATGCDLDGEKLKQLSRHQFKWLILTGNHKITNEAVKSLLNERFTTLGLGATAITDDVGASLVAMKTVNKVELYRNKITDRIFAHLSKMPLLQWLDLSETKITDEGLRSFVSRKPIRQLVVHRCPGLTDKGLVEFGKRNPRCSIEREATMYDR